MTDFIYTLLSAALINNFVLQQPLGADSLREAHTLPRHRLHALGIATCCLMLASSFVSYLILHYALKPLNLGYLRLFVVLPVIVSLLNPGLTVLNRLLPRLDFDGLRPLLLANTGLAGVVLLGIEPDQGFRHLLTLALGAGLGFWLVLSLLDDLGQRLRSANIPQPFRGLPIQLISVGLMGLAFMGFNGLVTA
ncbi:MULTISPECIES: Rnf-Nqr domain containing protein [Pseudomonas]|uniref:Electron transport complex protein RnfA n=1 Tax=Pseudomonas cichorii TaxID=36746 RepID=A0A3M4VEY2_PSECI|nr:MULTISPECIES: Rnf-Nqr domain containing protein [Pseudomonas]AHF69116.1 electron transport complex protein RnfA [Pseudomonas cichorii JBC1]QVE16084.1 NADH:quinone oxidoreductase [Pseudomonas cichorii]RMR50261.1 Electron transport complex protein RnfA [Pseudomonas cichorii]SDN20260.1 electron transport complex protein RnfA [Pseudomonas cichorii]GFM76724.1 electron transport complex subunit A [Pseudomonas cichorii]